MTKQIEPQTLRDWLDTQRPVTVLDIRTDDDHAQWTIPGSLHINAYEALRNGRPPSGRCRALAASAESCALRVFLDGRW
jgi:rhodanese-related sulfurtransferase